MIPAMAQPAVGMAELVERWTLVGDEHDLVSGKRGATRLGFALLLKFYTAYGRFPRGRSELADEVVEHVAGQVGVPASEIGFYAWSGSTHDYHRKQIRDHLGFRECSVADANKLADWLAVLVAPSPSSTTAPAPRSRAMLSITRSEAPSRNPPERGGASFTRIGRRRQPSSSQRGTTPKRLHGNTNRLALEERDSRPLFQRRASSSRTRHWTTRATLRHHETRPAFWHSQRRFVRHGPKCSVC
jgi:hypothetical protein